MNQSACLVRSCAWRLARRVPWLAAGICAVVFSVELLAAALPDFDFTVRETADGWRPVHDVGRLVPTAEGLSIEIDGADPYVHGPVMELASDHELWLRVRLKSETAGACQIFYFPEGRGASEAESVRFQVPAGEWRDTRIPLPSLRGRFRLRIDPPGHRGRCIVSRVSFEDRFQISAPKWPAPELPDLRSNALAIRSGILEIAHARDAFGAFEVRVEQQRMAVGNTRGLIGYGNGRATRWLELSQARVQVNEDGPGLSVSAMALDADSGRWKIQQRFAPAGISNAIQVEIRISVDRDRNVIYLPALTLFPGLGNFGTNKTQALFAGVDYLENEPSSSEADVRGPASRRKIPDAAKLTFPLMALSANSRYLGLTWESHPDIAAAFDSPDRSLGSKAHLMSLIFPGSNGENRDEGNLLPYAGQQMRANEELAVRAVILGGMGETVIGAVQQFVALRGLPKLPEPGLNRLEYFRSAAHSWLDSKIREGRLFRHAVWAGFGPQPAADAALWMDWLAAQLVDDPLSARLRDAAQEALQAIGPADYNAAAIGHIRYPTQALVYGATKENVQAAQQQARSWLDKFEPDGTVRYQPRRGGVDYGTTHFANHANGLTAQAVASLLEAAVFSGDRELLTRALQQLRGLSLYHDTVPRGAQTWEIPLHTPDILASAHLVRAYTLGYELTREPEFLDQAKYWAWTGVPFVYLENPTRGAIGLYATIPVLGATGWVAPVWIGLPVQWCGLVYAEALYELSKYDSTGPWRQLADGIVVAGMQMTWPRSDAERQGLLPDIFQLRLQFRDGPAINPATLLAPATRYWGATRVYDFRAFRRAGLILHAPGTIEALRDEEKHAEFVVHGWSRARYAILVHGVGPRARVRIECDDAPPTEPKTAADSIEQHLILEATGKARVQITWD